LTISAPLALYLLMGHPNLHASSTFTFQLLIVPDIPVLYGYHFGCTTVYYLKSQPFSLGYKSVLPTSLTYIKLYRTRNWSLWRPVAVSGTVYSTMHWIHFFLATRQVIKRGQLHPGHSRIVTP